MPSSLGTAACYFDTISVPVFDIERRTRSISESFLNKKEIVIADLAFMSGRYPFLMVTMVEARTGWLSQI